MDRDSLVADAIQAMNGVAIRTPFKRLPWLETITGFPVYAKLEFQQLSGSFKFRGAWNAVRLRRKQQVIAASAGNHGIAVATAGNILGLTPKIVLPTGASRIKRSKLAFSDAQVLESGDSLASAAKYARLLALENNWDYISPFADERVVAGGAALCVETLLQVGENIKTMIVPVGGGGLLSGALWAKKYLNSVVDIVGAEPESFASVAASLAAGKSVPMLNQPTLADGLAVQLSEEETTLPFLEESRCQLETSTEEEIAAATVSLLQNESWLVEPSGAIALSALVKLAVERRISGPTILILTGGNIQKSVLTRILSYPFSNRCALVRSLGLMGEAPEERHEPKTLMYCQRDIDQLESTDALLLSKWAGREWKEMLQAVRDSIDAYRTYCDQHALATPRELLDLGKKVLLLTEGLARKCAPTSNINAYFHTETTMRGLTILCAAVKRMFDWRSPSYDQSVVAQFFDLRSQENVDVNYDRYTNNEVTRIESQLREVLRVSDVQVACTVTSSGMAAFSLIEAYLFRYKFKHGASVAIAPYIYFEAAEQLLSLPTIKVHKLRSYDPEIIAESILCNHHDVVFVDPVSNNMEVRVCDIGKLLTLLIKKLTRPLSLVVDGTMASAQLPPILFAPEVLLNPYIEVLYYESCSKYLQLGFEHCLAGVVVHKTNLRPYLERLRRNGGLILYSSDAALFPRYTYQEYARHLNLIAANTAKAASLLATHPFVVEHLHVHSPMLPNHIDFTAAKSLNFTGGCISFQFKEAGLNARDHLNGFIYTMLACARKANLPLVKGVSFGFVTPRISASAAIAASEPPFLRLYVGLASDQIALLVEVFVAGLHRFLASEIVRNED